MQSILKRLFKSSIISDLNHGKQLFTRTTISQNVIHLIPTEAYLLTDQKVRLLDFNGFCQ